MIQNTNTYEAYEALEQAEEGDILDYTPHELTNAISENVSYVRNIIQTATEKNIDGYNMFYSGTLNQIHISLS
jgi:hypothetical protein